MFILGLSLHLFWIKDKRARTIHDLTRLQNFCYLKEQGDLRRSETCVPFSLFPCHISCHNLLAWFWLISLNLCLSTSAPPHPHYPRELARHTVPPYAFGSQQLDSLAFCMGTYWRGSCPHCHHVSSAASLATTMTKCASWDWQCDKHFTCCFKCLPAPCAASAIYRLTAVDSDEVYLVQDLVQDHLINCLNPKAPFHLPLTNWILKALCHMRVAWRP